ncbi:N/A [soil metagenome]
MLVFFKRILLRNWPIKSLVVLLVLAGFLAGLFISNYVNDRQDKQLQQRYDFLSRRVLIDNPSDTLLDFRTLQNDYQDYINRNNLADNISLFFEYLPTGSSIGIGENKELVGASLLKLPLVVSAYKLAEQGRLNLDQKVALKKEWLNDGFGELYKKGAGYEITYRQAVKYALEDSDNTAALMLFDVVSTKQGTASPNILGFVDANYATSPQENVLIGALSYTSVLKCVYYSCYLNRDDSQEILSTLAHSQDQTRLQLFLPEDVMVAHKIGTYGKEIQSDCGIFYIPKRNYALCIMIKGQDPQASQVIGDLSKMTYDYLAPDEKAEN